MNKKVLVLLIATVISAVGSADAGIGSIKSKIQNRYYMTKAKIQDVMSNTVFADDTSYSSTKSTSTASTSGTIRPSVYGNTTASVYTSSNNTDDYARIQDAISQASIKTGLPSSLISALIKKESGFNPNAVSRTGAIGLTQLMPTTAQHECRLAGDDLYNIESNIMCGAGYLSKQFDTFGNYELALAAYNAGPGAVRRAIESAGSRDFDDIAPLLKAETTPYVQKILSYMKEYNA